MNTTTPVLPRILLITGTDTGVGKTITTAALAAALNSTEWGHRTVAVYKPVQTGVRAHESGDIDEIRRLSGLQTVTEGIRLHAPMAPVAAAARENARLPGLRAHTERIQQLATSCDHVLVEGSGGILVELDSDRHTLADLAAALGDQAAIILVTRSTLGTLNHTQLTLEALTRRQLAISGIVIGSWPEKPDEVETTNADYLQTLDTPPAGTIPANAATMKTEHFRQHAPQWLAPLAAARYETPDPLHR
ncbi:MAG: dethiobiotin synthase [Actinomycetota bacterium]|nr:dethiobiotin synthase [Actinomycetota bacterium]